MGGVALRSIGDDASGFGEVKRLWVRPDARGDGVARLTELSRFVHELANMNFRSTQPFVGQSAFAHKGGMHVHAVAKATESYEHIAPEAVGNERRILVSELSGRSNILRFDLPTPGREPETAAPAATQASGERGPAFVAALGGAGNLTSVGACTTRLRLVLEHPEAIDEAALKALGSRGLLRLQGGGLQVILGPIADGVADEIRAAKIGRAHV